MAVRVAVVQATPVVLDGRCPEVHLSRGRVICDPWGNILAGPAHGGEEVLYADCELDLLLEARRVLDAAGHYDRADLSPG